MTEIVWFRGALEKLRDKLLLTVSDWLIGARLCDVALVLKDVAPPASKPSESSATNFNAAQPGASMENQHKHIKGYRDLSQSEIDAMNAIKAKAEEVGALVSQLRAQGSLDQRWVSIGATELQTGFMALTRSVAQPTTF